MHRNQKIQFRPEPEFFGTRNKNLAETGIFELLKLSTNHAL